MDLDLLTTYQAIVETGSTQAAARRLGLSQSAVSRRLTQLESDLGLSLFQRDRGRLIGTREARMLDGQIARLLDQGARLQTRAREIAGGNAASISLRIAVPGSLTLTILPQILQEFLTLHDRVQVEVHSGAYDTIERMLLDERAEVGFLRLPTQRAGLSTTPVITARTVCVMPHDHPLARRETISVEDLRNEPLILLGRMRQPRRDIDTLFWRYGLSPTVRIEAHSVMSACALVGQGLGITLVNELMARDYIHLPISIRPLTERIPHHFAFATSDQMPPHEAMASFITIATEKIRKNIGRHPTRETRAAISAHPSGDAPASPSARPTNEAPDEPSLR